MSKACENIFQRNASEFTKHSNLFIDSLHPQHKRSFLKLLQEASNFNCIIKMITASGVAKHIAIDAFIQNIDESATHKIDQKKESKILDLDSKTAKNIHYKIYLKDLSQHEDLFLSNAESQQKINILKDDSPYLYIELNKNLQIIDCNARSSVLQYKTSELLGKSFLDLLDKTEVSSQNFETQIKQAKISGLEISILNKNKEPQLFRLHSYSLFDHFGELKAYSLILCDMSELQATKTKLNSITERILSSGKKLSLGEISSGISHEINNPLAIIQGLAEEMLFLAEKEELKNKDTIEFCKKISQSVQRIGNIVTGISNFSNNFHKSDISNQKLVPIIENCVHLINYKLVKKQIHLIKDIPDKEIRALCSSNKLGQSLMHLLHNAAEAIAQLEEKWIKIHVHQDQQNVYIDVIDSGKGISKEISHLVMNDFFTTKLDQKALGLGLSLSKKLLEEQSASLKLLESTSNTCFRVQLQKAN